MAEAAVYLASPGVSYTTGITIFVDGGIMLP
jgi:NAD(P)-dependent dehydrogenase (short-subunit alcohol dehydrogenase family)